MEKYRNSTLNQFVECKSGVPLLDIYSSRNRSEMDSQHFWCWGLSWDLLTSSIENRSLLVGFVLAAPFAAGLAGDPVLYIMPKEELWIGGELKFKDSLHQM